MVDLLMLNRSLETGAAAESAVQLNKCDFIRISNQCLIKNLILYYFSVLHDCCYRPLFRTQKQFGKGIVDV